MDLKGKVALITGGGTGLGKEIGMQLAQEGADIAIAYTKSAKEAEETVAELRALGRRAVAIRADVSVAAEVDAMVETVKRELGRLDILVNNAGYTIFARDFGRLEDVSEADWDRIMDVNVKGAFLCTRAAVPLMREAGEGRIVNITSNSGVRPGGSSIPYSVSKAAEVMLTKCLAMGLAPEITVNNVAPGLMDTRWGRLWGDDAMENVAKATPLKRLPTVKDIAATAVFLIKNDSITGQTYVVDSGAFMH